MMRAPSNTRSAVRRGKASAGIILLEVVLALTLFVSMAATVGAAMNHCSRAAERLRIRTHTADLAVSLISEIQLGLLDAIDTDATAYEDDTLADWMWEIRVDAVSMATAAKFVEVRVTHVPTGLFHRIGYLN